MKKAHPGWHFLCSLPIEKQEDFFMKKILFLFTATVGIFAATTTVTTEDTVSRSRLGVEAGMIWSDVSTPSQVSASNRTGLAAGLNVEVPINATASFQPGIVFVQRGAELASAGNARLVTKMNSLEFPLLFKAKINQEMSPYIVAGPVFTWNIDSKLEAQTPGGSTAIGYDPEAWELGATAGIGADIGPVTVGARYLWGLTSADKNSSDYKAKGLYALLGIRI
jgi:hypothetical protein